jgi:hypothetical protein
MFAYLCVLAEQLMPGARKSQTGLDVCFYNRRDGQLLMMAMSFHAPKAPVLLVSVFATGAARIGVFAGTTSLLVNGRSVPVRVTRCMRYAASEPIKLNITFCVPFDVQNENHVSAPDVLRVLVSAF